MLLTCVAVLGVWVLGRFDFNPSEVLGRPAARSGEGSACPAPGLLVVKPLDSISMGVAFALGTAGLPHILMRFYTVPDARAARGSVGWAVLFIGIFYVLVSMVGFGSRALLGPAGEKLAGSGGNLVAPLRVRSETAIGTDSAAAGRA